MSLFELRHNQAIARPALDAVVQGLKTR